LARFTPVIGYVPQEPFSFFQFAQSQILPWAEKIFGGGVARAVEIAKLDRDVEIFPLGLETLVRRARRGRFLAGQKQRATLARALSWTRRC